MDAPNRKRQLGRDRSRRRRARARLGLVTLTVSLDRDALHCALRAWRYINDSAEDDAATLQRGLQQFVSDAVTRDGDEP
jgi:hypothetical protein